MERMQKSVFWAILATEMSHVFCCVLPTIFSVAGFLAGVGLIGAMPAGFETLHNFIHRWEIPLIIFSGVTIALGWAIDRASKKVDCHNTGCVHEPCGTRKYKAHKVLVVASVLFLFNVVIYFALHQGLLPTLPHNH